ncbi:MAG TPA: L,D-transpeptidase, partial [Gaiellaceae bacterium]
LSGRIVYPESGKPVQVHFSAPVKVVSVRMPDGTATTLTLKRARRVASLGITAGGENIAGTAFVAGAPRTWESLPDPVRVNWFPAGPRPSVLVRPAPKSNIVPSAPIILTFSRPVREILGRAKPVLKPKVKGVWTKPNDHTLVFTPSGLGFPLGRRVHLRLPQELDVISGSDPSPFRTLTWQVPRASLMRIKQLLAVEGYLPVDFKTSGKAVRMTAGAQVRAAVEPPAGTFVWRYPKTPVALKSLWDKESSRATMMRGAIMAFEDTHGMPADGFPSMPLYRALVRDELAGKQAAHGYSYVYVTEKLPEMLTLWHEGHVILRAAINTGIASRPTDIGTYPVYLHLVSTTMEGTNPDGSHYHDVGVPWVNYFSGGDAVHGFYRGSYGWPQSLGCVEAPFDTAGRIFPFVHVGTLVTVSPE